MPECLPKLEWKFAEENGQLKLIVKSDRHVERVDAWTASSKTRDFRQSEWKSKSSERNGESHVCELGVPTEGCAALFGEVVFAGENNTPYYLSTNVQIVGPAHVRSARAENARNAALGVQLRQAIRDWRSAGP